MKQDFVTRLNLDNSPVYQSIMKPFNRHQPDQGGVKRSAKAIIPLPFADPPAEDATDKSTDAPNANDPAVQSNGDGQKGSVRTSFRLPHLPSLN